MEPSESHRLLLDNKNIWVFKLNSTATGSLTWQREDTVMDTGSSEIFFSNSKHSLFQILLAGIWYPSQTWRVLWDCRRAEPCTPCSGLLYKGSVWLCTSQSSLSPGWRRRDRSTSVSLWLSFQTNRRRLNKRSYSKVRREHPLLHWLVVGGFTPH